MEPFNQPARQGIRILLKNEHYNIVLPQDSALAPETNPIKDGPLLFTSMHWATTWAVTKLTPTDLLPTALQIEHNIDIDRKKNADFSSKEMKELGSELLRLQNRYTNSLHVARRKIKVMYEKEFTGQPTYERQDFKEKTDRTSRPQSNDKNARPQERPKQPSRDRKRPTSNPPKSTHITKMTNTKIKTLKQLTESLPWEWGLEGQL